MLDEMYKDYVRTAFAKGVSKPRVLFVHVLKNAMIPIITNVVIAIPFLYTGSLLLENFFGIPRHSFVGYRCRPGARLDRRAPVCGGQPAHRHLLRRSGSACKTKIISKLEYLNSKQE